MMAENMRPFIEQTGGLITLKAIYKKCNHNELLPWGYVSIGPDIGFNLTQDQFNQIQTKQLGNEALIDSLHDLTLETIEDEYGVDADDISFTTPRVILSSDFANISAIQVQNNTAAQTLVITSSTVINNRAIDYFITFNRLDNSIKLGEVVQILNDNAMMLQSLNKAGL